MTQRTTTTLSGFSIRTTTAEDVPTILAFIRRIAEYEKLLHEVVADEETLRESLFGERPTAEVVLGEREGETIAFAVYFHNFSTFMGRPGIYLEDLFVLPEHRGSGAGKALLLYLANLAKERNCARLEWNVLDWNEPALKFYHKLGAVPMDEWTIHRVTGDALDTLATRWQQEIAAPV